MERDYVINTVSKTVIEYCMADFVDSILNILFDSGYISWAPFY